MDNQPKETELFIHADQKIESIRSEVSEVIRSIISQGQKIDQLSERINEGVSKTAYKTFEKVNEISVAITNLNHENEKRDITIKELKEDVKIQRTNWNTFVRIFIFGIATTLLVFLIKQGFGSGL